MIYTSDHFTKNETLKCDVCIVGSGAGGAYAAHALSSRGKSVILVESGSFHTLRDFSQREEAMFPKLFYEAGNRRTSDRKIRVLHGKGVGGSTLHNVNLCKRIPEELFALWNLKGLSFAQLEAHYQEVETLLGVKKIAENQVNRANTLFRAGTQKLGYKGAILSHNRTGCVGSGFCELGCSYDGKNNALKVLIPKIVGSGKGRVLADAKVTIFEMQGRRVVKARVSIRDPRLPPDSPPKCEITIEANAFVSCAGGIETPLLLQRSRIPDPFGLIGSKLFLHPGTAALGFFEEKVESWMGVPQSWECTEFLGFGARDANRVWLIGGSAHPAGAASILPGFGSAHRELMHQYPHIVPISPMVHDQSCGRVSQDGEHRVKIDYELNAKDQAQLGLGLFESAKILFAAGARQVLIPFVSPILVSSVDELMMHRERLNHCLGETDIVSVHPMGSVWMGNSPESSCLDVTGRYHHLDNLFVADMSVYPTSIGVPPQISTYAMGKLVGENVARMV